jgi:hypothetical protein
MPKQCSDDIRSVRPGPLKQLAAPLTARLWKVQHSILFVIRAKYPTAAFLEAFALYPVHTNGRSYRVNTFVRLLSDRTSVSRVNTRCPVRLCVRLVAVDQTIDSQPPDIQILLIHTRTYVTCKRNYMKWTEED